MEPEDPHGWHGNTTDEKRETLFYPWYRHAIRWDIRSKFYVLISRQAAMVLGEGLF